MARVDTETVIEQIVYWWGVDCVLAWVDSLHNAIGEWRTLEPIQVAVRVATVSSNNYQGILHQEGLVPS